MYIRPKDKIESYIEYLGKKSGTISKIVPGTQSRYYYIKDKVLRVSDHIGLNSSGSVSILIPQNGQNKYIIHGHNSGQVSILDYEKTKELIRSFFCLSSIFGEIAVKREDVNEESKEQQMESKRFGQLLTRVEEINSLIEKANLKEKTIMGVPIHLFSEGQLNAVIGMINKVKKENKLL